MQLQQKRYRLEIEGLRAVAAILVALYHIWFNRVSGGVDVFFTLSGFLITTSLLSMHTKTGTVLPITYIIKLLKRLIPTAWFVAISTFIASYFLAPIYMRSQNFSEFIASLFYWENWRLAFNSIDYLAQNNSASSFQHFWALGMQFQFYVSWVILFSITLCITKIIKEASFRRILLILFILLGTISFSYSVYLTNINQPFAYYHTFTRIWEFTIGGIVALTIHRISLTKKAAWFAGWIGLVSLLLCGIVLQVSTVFPGYAALWPTLAAVLILIAGDTSKKYSAYRLLSSPPLVSFGKVSYAFYLWHWPILVLYLQTKGHTIPSLSAGIGIILLSALLAYMTIQWIENPLRRQETSTKTGIIQLTATATIIGILLFSYNLITEKKLATLANAENLGARAIDETNTPFTITSEIITPAAEEVKRDKADVYGTGCIQITDGIHPIMCAYGEIDNPVATIALIGGSHAAHWQPMLRKYGEQNNVQIKTYVKGNCLFTLAENNEYPDCLPWLENVLAEIEANKENIDLVVTVGDTSAPSMRGKPVVGMAEAWENISEMGIPLFLIRDTPRFNIPPVACISEHGLANASVCNMPIEEALGEINILLEAKLPPNTTIFDATKYFCDETTCYPIVGNVYTLFDDNHISATFSRSLTFAFTPYLNEALGITPKSTASFNNE